MSLESDVAERSLPARGTLLLACEPQLAAALRGIGMDLLDCGPQLAAVLCQDATVGSWVEYCIQQALALQTDTIGTAASEHGGARRAGDGWQSRVPQHACHRQRLEKGLALPGL